MTGIGGDGGRSAVGYALLTSRAMTPDWAPAYATVPRSAFLPDLIWPYDMDAGHSVAVDRAEDPILWQEYADANVPVVTQWDDGQQQGREPGVVGTSSASMPSVVLSMLRDLSVLPGNRVLEIGTGTGWSTALLAYRLGDVNVTSIELDPDVADQARKALARFHSAPTVLTGDGVLGHPDGAPYDRIIATVGMREIPYCWVEQAQPGAVIVAPWGTHFSTADAVARLVVSDDRTEACGPFTGPVEFMKLRAQRLPAVAFAEHVGAGVDTGEASSTTITEAEWARGPFSPLEFAIGLRVRDCLHVPGTQEDGARVTWFYSLRDRSWACLAFVDGQDTASVWQGGARRLWDEIETAVRWWSGKGGPGHDRFGLTVTTEGQRVWLDDPVESWPV